MGKCQVTYSVLDKNKIRKLVLFLDDAWFKIRASMMMWWWLWWTPWENNMT
jgi:hypothetical protein